MDRAKEKRSWWGRWGPKFNLVFGVFALLLVFGISALYIVSGVADKGLVMVVEDFGKLEFATGLLILAGIILGALGWSSVRQSIHDLRKK
jgi:hypothetical protein